MSEWRIDRANGEIVGPCQCRLPWTQKGIEASRTHSTACPSPDHAQHLNGPVKGCAGCEVALVRLASAVLALPPMKEPR
jgi:hypothetical protein